MIDAKFVFCDFYNFKMGFESWHHKNKTVQMVNFYHFFFLPQEGAVVACSSINDIWFFFIVLNSDALDFLVYQSKDTTSDIYSVFNENSSKTSVKNIHRVFAIIQAF